MSDSYRLMLKKNEFELDKLELLKEHQLIELHSIKNKIQEFELKIFEIQEKILVKNKEIEWIKSKIAEGKDFPEEGQ